MSNKFKKTCKGPLKVIERCSEVIYKIQLESESTVIKNVHINRLLQYLKEKRGNDNYFIEQTPLQPNETLKDTLNLNMPFQPRNSKKFHMTC